MHAPEIAFKVGICSALFEYLFNLALGKLSLCQHNYSYELELGGFTSARSASREVQIVMKIVSLIYGQHRLRKNIQQMKHLQFKNDEKVKKNWSKKDF